MLVLASTSDLLQVVTSSTADLDVHASWVDLVDAATTVTPGRTNTLIVTATTTTVVASPGASTKRTANFLSCKNDHASTANDVTVLHTDGTIVANLIKVTLAAGEALVHDHGTWFVYDVNGAVKGVTGVAASDTASGVIEIAIQSEQESAADVGRAVTPGRQHFHPSACKCWASAGTTGNLLGSYNMTSATDTGTGDIALTIATDFSAATTYAVSMSVQRINSTAAEANARIGTIKTASLAAGSFSMDCWDNTVTTMIVKDPTTWHATGFGDL